MQAPKEFLGKEIWNESVCVPMGNLRPDSNEAVAERLKLLRQVMSGGSQTSFAAKLGIETKRWNNFERGTPLSKEVAFLLVQKFPDVTLDWLWLGIETGLPVRLQRELREAVGNATTSPTRRSASRTG